MASIEINNTRFPIISIAKDEGLCAIPVDVHGSPLVQAGTELPIRADADEEVPERGVLTVIDTPLDQRDRSTLWQPRLAKVALGATVLGRLIDGSAVFARAASHITTHLNHDTGLRTLVTDALPHMAPEEEQSFQVAHDFGRVIGYSECVPVDPSVDTVFYVRRNGRSSFIPIVANRDKEPTTKVTLILGRASGPDDSPGVYEAISAWTGDKAPAIPGSPFATPDSEDFWQTHALVDMDHGGQPYDRSDPTTITRTWPFGPNPVRPTETELA